VDPVTHDRHRQEIATMHAASSFRLLLVPALSLLPAACDDSESPLEAPVVAEEAAAPTREEPAALAGTGRWAAGYLHAGSPTSASYAPLPYLSYNASEGAMNITKPAGTTGRYVVTFRGLSALLGTKNTVHVTEYGIEDAYCKPLNGRLVSDKLEVRCFKASTRAPANAAFTVLVSGVQSQRAFAYAHLPTATDYSPAAAGSYNPAGAIKVLRSGVGEYRVVFTNLASAISTSRGHTQVNAVGTGKAHCTVEDWGAGGTPNLNVFVQCYTPAGVPVDSKFTVLFVLAATHLAYAYADQPSAASYSPHPTLSSNPAGGAITITRNGTGEYTVVWAGVDPEIVEGGTVQVTAASLDNTQCKATSLFDSGAVVRCFATNGNRVDAYYTVMLSS
jgi:hypothetical protein